MTKFDHPNRCCDLVMKGGITSGILYPPAVCRLAERFHLVGIGGTSAGAIAACAAAAAEYRRRQTESGVGFEVLEHLPEQLAGPDQLLGLFRPDRTTRKAFRLLEDSLGLSNRGWFARAWWKARALWVAIRHNKTLQPLVDNGFGLCTGMAIGNRPKAGEIAPLAEWLSQTIDTIAGMPTGTPLTFGDLRHVKKPAALQQLSCDPEERSIDLRAVTTCVTFGRPLELPFDGTNIFAFDEQEFRRLFPGYVVDYMVKVAKEIHAPTLRVEGKLPFPVGDRMPVVVAARMSLSFPGLFTLVPLYAVDYEGDKSMKKVWFSDGGITSNMPIHRFDALFPRWPTLAINLQYTGKDDQPARSIVDPQDLIYMIARRQDGIRDLWHEFDGKKSPTHNMIGFACAVFRSAQVWHDNSFLKLPGFRDRVVEIWLKEKEGGMNLNMPSEVIEELIRRGNQAGIELRQRFAGEPADHPLSWNAHRWVRLRSALAGLSEYLRNFGRNAGCTSQHESPLKELLAARDAPPTAVFHPNEQYEAAKPAIEALLGYIRLLDQGAEICQHGHKNHACAGPFCGGPRPPVVIGSKARM